MIKRILNAFLIVCACLSVWAQTGSGTADDPWQLTETMTAILDNEGTLTIRGTGEMPDGGGWVLEPMGSEWVLVFRPFGWSPDKDKVKAVIVGKGVTSIGNCVFFSCTNLISVTIPDSVRTIKAGAFMDCEGLTTVTIPDGMASVGVRAFGGCSGLFSMAIPSSVTNIGLGAFAGCTGLKTMTIPDSVISIEADMFQGCTELTSVSIPKNVTNIGSGAFAGCIGLTTMTIPDSVTSIDADVFRGCTGLASVVIPTSVANIGSRAFAGCVGLKTVTIPDNVTSIEAEVFRGCTGLASVVIPKGVTNIGSGAFAGCSGLKDVYFSGVVPSSVASDAFSSCNADLILHAPRGWTGRTRILGGVYLVVDGEIMGVQLVNLTVTNVVVNYVLNSVQPEFANPPIADTGFVNIITEVKGGAVAIPSSWAENYPAFESKFGSDFTQALSMKTGKKDGAGNDMFVWQDYVAGTDPTKPEDKFTASITVVDGKVTVSYTPELDEARKALRKYTTWGKKSLLGTDWTVVQEGQEAEYNFFKVSVEMK